jgi:hypothetical protein
LKIVNHLIEHEVLGVKPGVSASGNNRFTGNNSFTLVEMESLLSMAIQCLTNIKSPGVVATDDFDLLVSGGDSTSGDTDGRDLILQGGNPSGSGNYGKVKMRTDLTSYCAIFNMDEINDTDKTFNLPNSSGTVALSGDPIVTNSSYILPINLEGYTTTANLDFSGLGSDNTYSFPDATGTIALLNGVDGSFTTADLKTVTVTNGLITNISS